MGSINRVVMRKAFKELMQAIDASSLAIAEISGRTGQGVGSQIYDVYRYPDHDICNATLPRKYDLVIADQVWEHLQRPYRATQNVISSLNPGGYFYVASPFFVPYHPAPVDCSRWSADGLKNLLIEAGFEEDNVASYQWGNRWVAMRNVTGPFPPQYDRKTDRLQNEDHFPVMAWALAQKSV